MSTVTLALGGVLVMSAAAGAAGIAATAPALLALSGAGGQHRVVRADPNDPWLFVAGQVNNTVNAYDLTQPGMPRVETITQGVRSPVGLTFDPVGDLYVSNAGGNVTVYPPGQTTPIRTLQVASPVGVAFDNRGHVFVATRDSTPSILVYRPHQVRPYRTITSPLLQVPSQIAMDHFDTLYITDNNTGVSVLKTKTDNVESLGLQNLDSCPTGIAIDYPRKELFVSGCLGGTKVYAIGNTVPVRSLDESFPADNVAMGRVNGKETFFAPDLFSNTVTFYHADDSEPYFTLTTGSQQALGIAVKPAGVP